MPDGQIIHYRADGTVDVRRAVKSPSLPELQNLVGGYIEVVHVLYNSQRAQMIVNEDGIGLCLPMNERATELYRETACHVGSPTAHVIVGDVAILTGSAMVD